MFKRISTALLFFIIITPGYGQEWIARYQGPYGEDYAYAIAVDGQKNVYVTGASQGPGGGYIPDYATIKYDSLGTAQWVARYNGCPTENWQDEARAIAVDGNGVYVTGYTKYYIVDDSSDYCTIKYNKETGETLWIRTYNGTANNCDQAYAIALDGTGNVYVTGKSKGDGTNFDFLTVKYSPDGVEQWTARYNNPSGNGWDIAYALAVDNNGDIYVTGESYDPTTYYDCTTIKYNSSGAQQWVQRYSCQDDYTDEGNAITVDASGNVYVTGRSVDTPTSWDYLTIKYNSGGVQQWIQRFDGIGEGDEPSDIGIDNLGNVYVTGASGIGGFFQTQYATVKYTSTGTQEWVRTYIGPANFSAKAAAIAIDNQNNICVTGSDGAIDTTWDYVTIKYTPSGTEEWVARYSAGIPAGDDQARAIATDMDGNIYVTGSSESADGNPDYLTIKYPPSGPGVEETVNPKFKIREPQLVVSPNPFTTFTMITLGDNVPISIYDISGKLVQRIKIHRSRVMTIGENLSPGIYFLKTKNCRPVKILKIR